MFNRHTFLAIFITALFAATTIVSPVADAVSPAQTGDQHGTAEPEDDTTEKQLQKDDVEPGDPCEDLEYAVAEEHMGECSVKYRAYVVGLKASPHITSQPYQKSFGCRVYFETEDGKKVYFRCVYLGRGASKCRERV